MTDDDFNRFEQMIFRFKEEIKEDFRIQIGAQAEAFQHKLDILVEGHRMLSDKVDRNRLELKQDIACVVQKLDAVAARGEMTAVKLDQVAVRGEMTAAKLDQVAAKLDETVSKLDAVAARGDETAAKLDQVIVKLDAVAADLHAHRTDTEAHQSVYRIKE